MFLLRDLDYSNSYNLKWLNFDSHQDQEMCNPQEKLSSKSIVQNIPEIILFFWENQLFWGCLFSPSQFSRFEQNCLCNILYQISSIFVKIFVPSGHFIFQIWSEISISPRAVIEPVDITPAI